MSDTDLAQIAQDEGWDADEVDAIRTLLGRATPSQPATDEANAPAPAPVESVAIPVDLPLELPPDDVHPMDELSAGADASEPIPSTGWASPEPFDAALRNPEVSADEGTEVTEPEAADGLPEAPEPMLSVEETIRRSLAARGERPSSAPEPEWLRRRRGPAARAYRRLRRLLPG
jgi:hypothetical protein